jgi:CcmD family protein
MLDYAVSIKYMTAGYLVIFTVLAIYLISLFVRWKNLKRDMETLKEIQKKG